MGLDNDCALFSIPSLRRAMRSMLSKRGRKFRLTYLTADAHRRERLHTGGQFRWSDLFSRFVYI